MSVGSGANGTHCQLVAGGPGGAEPRLWRLGRHLGVARVRRLAARAARAGHGLRSRAMLLARGAYRRLCGRRCGAAGGPAPRACTGSAAVIRDYERGDRVRVRSPEEIRSTLDPRRGLEGRRFTDSMHRHCGGEYRVERRVWRYFDDVGRRMVACEAVYSLEGVCCDGSGGPEASGCDRMCPCFWPAEWLEPLRG